jgi:sugar lactone lactonase YvrE
VQTTSSKIALLGGDKDTPGSLPNGITLSPDERLLYVTAGAGRTMRYDILPDDTVANSRLFVAHGSDDLRVDRKGNLYSSSGGTPAYHRVHSLVQASSQSTRHSSKPAGKIIRCLARIPASEYGSIRLLLRVDGQKYRQ